MIPLLDLKGISTQYREDLTKACTGVIDSSWYTNGVDTIFHDRPIKVFNNGEMSRDFTYIDDIVDGIIKVIDNPAQPIALQGELSSAQERDHLGGNTNPKNLKPKNLPPQVSTAPYRLYNIGNNAPLPLMTFIETIEDTLGEKAEKNFMPMQDGDVVSTYADVSGLINDFGYKPDTKLTDGIEEFVKWYKNFYKE